MRPLTADMLDYAAQDTIYLLELRDRAEGGARAAGRWEWAAEEFALLEGTTVGDDDPAEAFLRVKGARDLTRRELAMLRELVPWRDAVARALDRATFRVVGNEALLDIARVTPRRARRSARSRVSPARCSSSAPDDMLAAVERGLAVADADLPRFPRRTPLGPRPRFRRARRPPQDGPRRDGGALDLDPGRARARASGSRPSPGESRRTLEELAEVPDLRRWQIEVMGEAMLKTMGGTKAKSPYADA